MQVIFTPKATSPRIKGFAQAMRAKQTPGEIAMGEALKALEPFYVILAQHHCCGYVLDFLIRDARVCVEVDGGYHKSAKQRAKDSERGRFLRYRAGIITLRFWDEDVLLNADKIVAEHIHPAVLRNVRSLLAQKRKLMGEANGSWSEPEPPRERWPIVSKGKKRRLTTDRQRPTIEELQKIPLLHHRRP